MDHDKKDCKDEKCNFHPNFKDLAPEYRKMKTLRAQAKAERMVQKLQAGLKRMQHEQEHIIFANQLKKEGAESVHAH